MSSLRRLLNRPSSRLVRAILIPLTAVQLAVTVYLVLLTSQLASDVAYDRIEGMVQALAMSEPPDPVVLDRMAEWAQADRIWVVSATGRILASSRAAEVGGLVDDVWWQDLPPAERRVRRQKEWGSTSYAQIAYHDIERGAWAMAISDIRTPALTGSARLAALLVMSLAVWLLMAGSVVYVIRRTLGRSLDVSDLVARKALAGEAASTASLARLRSSAPESGPARLVLELVERMQERASRAVEAESRFSLAVELLPGIAYLAAYDGTLLFAGPLLRQHLGAESQVGKPVTDLLPGLPLDRVHTAAEKSHARGVTFDNLPVREAVGDRPAMRASIRTVVFRGTPAYLAHIEAVNDAGDATSDLRDPGSLEAQLVSEAHEIIIAFDASTRTLVWNRAAERFCGARKTDVPNLRAAIEQLFSSAEAMEAFGAWMEGTPESEPLELECKAADGRCYAVTWKAHELVRKGRTVGGALFGKVAPASRSEDRTAVRMSLAKRRHLARQKQAGENSVSQNGEAVD